MYLRGITLGGQDEVIYEETDSLKIARAFRKAGRGMKHEWEEGDCFYRGGAKWWGGDWFYLMQTHEYESDF